MLTSFTRCQFDSNFLTNWNQKEIPSKIDMLWVGEVLLPQQILDFTSVWSNRQPPECRNRDT